MLFLGLLELELELGVNECSVVIGALGTTSSSLRRWYFSSFSRLFSSTFGGGFPISSVSSPTLVLYAVPASLSPCLGSFSAQPAPWIWPGLVDPGYRSWAQSLFLCYQDHSTRHLFHLNIDYKFFFFHLFKDVFFFFALLVA